jgi:hypothetical protein
MRQQTKEQISRLHQDGYNVTAIAAMTGVPPGTVRSHLRRRSDTVHPVTCPQCGNAVKRSLGHPNKKILLRPLPYGVVEQPSRKGQQNGILHPGLPPMWKGV